MESALRGVSASAAALALVGIGYGLTVGGSDGLRAVLMGAALSGLALMALGAANRVARWRRRW